MRESRKTKLRTVCCADCSPASFKDTVLDQPGLWMSRPSADIGADVATDDEDLTVLMRELVRESRYPIYAKCVLLTDRGVLFC